MRTDRKAPMPEIIFNGPEGRLEGRYHHSKQEKNPSIALMLHPHPQYGGSMNNRVIYQMYHCFVRRLFRAAVQFPRRRSVPGRG